VQRDFALLGIMQGKMNEIVVFSQGRFRFNIDFIGPI
jgi:hypothetical protein